MTDTNGANFSDEQALAVAGEAVAGLQELARRLSAAAGAEHTATAADGSITAVAAGGRLRSVQVDPATLDRGDHAAFVRVLTATVRAALAAPPPSLDGQALLVPTAAAPVGPNAPDPRTVERFAARSFPGASSDGAVTAAVSGGGELAELEVAVAATRGDHQREDLGARVVEAVNAALGARAEARAAEFGLADASAEIRAQADAFVNRMADVEAQVSQLRVQLAARLAEVRQLHAGRPTPPNGS